MSCDYFFERKRGDTVPFEITVKVRATGQPADITGYSFTMTADPEENPANGDNNIFSLAGTINDPLTGVVQFQPQEADVDYVGDYWFDIEYRPPAGTKETLVKDRILFEQDITK